MAGYWSNGLRNRGLTRRRALALVASGLGSAAILAACSDSKDEAGTKDKSGLLTKSEDTTSKAKPGGTLTVQAQTMSTSIPYLTN